MSRLGQRQLIAMADAMPARRRLIIETVAALRLISGGQLRRCCFDVDGARPASVARLARMELAGLIDARILLRLDRRVGGVRSGSDGYVYALGSVGRRLVEYFAGRGLPRTRSSYEPGEPFVAHALQISETYTRLIEADQTDACELLEFAAEPGCWRPYVGPLGGAMVVKPDAYLRLGLGADEAVWFIEVDQATERRGALERKHRAYLGYYRSGREQAEHGLFPRVLWIVPDARRQNELRQIATGLGDDAQAIFQTTTSMQAIAILTEAETTGATS